MEDVVVSVFDPEVVVSVLVLFEFIDVSEPVVPDAPLVPVVPVVPLAPIELVLFALFALSLSVPLFIVLLRPFGVLVLVAPAALVVELLLALGEVDDELLDVWARATPPRVSAAAAARVVRVCLVVIIRNFSFSRNPAGLRVGWAGPRASCPEITFAPQPSKVGHS